MFWNVSQSFFIRISWYSRPWLVAAKSLMASCGLREESKQISLDATEVNKKTWTEGTTAPPRRFLFYLLLTLLYIFYFHLVPYPVHPTGFYLFLAGFLAIFILSSKNMDVQQALICVDISQLWTLQRNNNNKDNNPLSIIIDKGSIMGVDIN